MRRPGGIVLAFLLVCPLVAAHPGEEYPVVQSSGDGISGFLTIQTMALMVGREANFTLGIFDANTYSPQTSVARAFLQRAGTPPREIRLTANESGDRMGSIVVDERGPWRLRVVVNETASLTFPFEA